MTDTRVVLLVVGLLGMIALCCVGASAWLTSHSQSSSVLDSVAATCVGALAGVLASTRTKPMTGGGE